MAFSPSNRLLRCLFVACLPMAALAAPPRPADPAVLEVDKALQQLKAEVVDINQQAIRAEDDFVYPEQTRLTVYVGVKAPALLVDEVVITIDSLTPIRRKLDLTEAVALQRRGLYRALRLNVKPGPHRLRAEYAGRFADAAPDSPKMRGNYETVFDKTELASDLEVQITTPGLNETPVISLRDWRPTR